MNGKLDISLDFSEQIYREISLKRHTTVHVPRGITEAIEEFLKTEQAAKLGFNSKTDLITAAVRNLLTQYGYYHRFENN